MGPRPYVYTERGSEQLSSLMTDLFQVNLGLLFSFFIERVLMFQVPILVEFLVVRRLGALTS